MDKKIIIFDKDGTLLKFGCFWLPVTYAVLDELRIKYELSESDIHEFEERAGFCENDFKLDGTLCGGTYRQLSDMVFDILQRKGIQADNNALCDEVTKMFEDSCCENGSIVPSCNNIRELFLKLKERGGIIVMVTNDNTTVTAKCLDSLGIRDLFDRIFTCDDTLRRKPDPYLVNVILDEYGVDRKDVYMVGDTLIDMNFAANGKINGIGVYESEHNAKIIAPYAMTVTNDLWSLLDIIW